MTTKTRKEVISGDLIQVVNQETDEALGVTTEDIELEIDEDTADQELSTQRRKIRRRTYNEATLSVESLISSDLDTLDKTGIIDASDNGRVIFDEDSRTWDDGVLLKVFDGIDDVTDAAETEPEQQILCETAEWSSEGVDYSDDFATIALSAMIHGDIYLDWEEAA